MVLSAPFFFFILFFLLQQQPQPSPSPLNSACRDAAQLNDEKTLDPCLKVAGEKVGENVLKAQHDEPEHVTPRVSLHIAHF